MKYAITTFALIITLVGGFIFGAYYMYNKYNPSAETVSAPETASTEQTEELDNSGYYDENGNWIFKYSEDESGYKGNGNTISSGGKAVENIDFRITGTNFVYEDDGAYSGFHAVVTVENIGGSNLYLGRDSVFDIEDRNLEIVDSYNYVRAVPDVIAPGEKGYFYVPYGQIKTNEDSVTIEEGDLSGDTLDPMDENTLEGNFNSEEENKAIDIEELEDALSGEEETSASIKNVKVVDFPTLLAQANEADTDSSENSENKEDENKENESAQDSSSEASTEVSSEGGSSENGASDAESTDAESTDAEKEDAEALGAEKTDADDTESETEEAAEAEDPAATAGESASASEEEKTEYKGLSLYKVHEYFILPNLDVQKCSNEPHSDFSITNIIYGSNDAGYFTLTGDVSNTTEANIDYVPVTVVALDRRGNAIAVGKDSINDFYSGATKNFGVSYILTREERSNIVQCVVYAREAVNN
ncbi:FxLYD domain-containing protein [Butyrivibrio sp. NC2002]|uniref:FxLYD domain-containing protein n=1 Tax=Butyrivibrio sp. NC2002 TaxID=1410610 RepID=UPI00055D2F26|nr:FxLYD domain-containing protein [Butyrivibrio sp. NC2002]